MVSNNLEKTNKAITQVISSSTSILAGRQAGRVVNAVAGFFGAGITTPSISQVQDALAEGLISQKDYEQAVKYEMNLDPLLKDLFVKQGQQIIDRQTAGLSAAIKLNLSKNTGESLTDFTTRANNEFLKQQAAASGSQEQAVADIKTNARNQQEFEQKLVEMGVAITDPGARARFFRTHPQLAAESAQLDAATKKAFEDKIATNKTAADLAIEPTPTALARRKQQEQISGTTLPGSLPPNVIFPPAQTPLTQTQQMANIGSLPSVVNIPGAPNINQQKGTLRG